MSVHLLLRARGGSTGTLSHLKRELRARKTQAGTSMSLTDISFDGMFRGDGGMLDGDDTPRCTCECSWCREECEDEGEEFCKAHYNPALVKAG